MDDSPVRVERRRYNGHAAKHTIGAKPRAQTPNVPHAIDDRQDNGCLANRRSELVCRVSKRIRFHRDENKVELFVYLMSLNRARRHIKVAMRAANAEAVSCELLSALLTHHEGNVPSRTQ